MSLALDLLERLRTSPYAVLALRDGIEIELGSPEARIRLRSPEGRLGVYSDVAASAHIDGTLECSEADVLRMVGQLPPVDGVRLLHGARDIAPRRKQAHLLLVAAALGWDGPWPDPTANAEHHALVAEALADLAIGPRDALFDARPDARLDAQQARAEYNLAGMAMRIRQTDSASGRTLLLDAGTNALCLDVPARGDLTADLSRLARVGAYLATHCALPEQVRFNDLVWTFAPDSRFPRGWTMPEHLGTVWKVTPATASADQKRG